MEKKKGEKKWKMFPWNVSIADCFNNNGSWLCSVFNCSFLYQSLLDTSIIWVFIHDGDKINCVVTRSHWKATKGGYLILRIPKTHYDMSFPSSLRGWVSPAKSFPMIINRDSLTGWGALEKKFRLSHIWNRILKTGKTEVSSSSQTCSYV